MGRHKSASSRELLVFLKIFKESLAQQERRRAVAVVLQCASRGYLARKCGLAPVSYIRAHMPPPMLLACAAACRCCKL